MDLEGKDREAADRAYDRKFQFGKFMMDYQMQMQNATRQTFQNLLDKAPQALYNGLLANPSRARDFQSIMGIDMKTLSGIASSIETEKSLALDLKREQILTERAQRGKIIKETEKIGKEIAPISGLTPEASSGIETVNNLLSLDSNLDYLTGKKSYIPSVVLAGTNAAYQRSQLANLKAQLSLENRQKMKGQGAISDFESRMLAEASSAIVNGLTKEALKQELSKIRAAFALGAGQTVVVKIVDPKTGEAKEGTIGRDDLQDAINKGYLIKY
jgi:hypothetical protein